MIAQYMRVDTATLEMLKTLQGEDLSKKIRELENQLENAPNVQSIKIVDIGKLWDVLHFVLTKKSATTPVPDSPLSEAIVGIETFSDANGSQADDFISYSQWAEIIEIVEALEKVDFAKLLKNQNLKDWRQQKLFPKGIWDDKKDNISKELMASFNELKTLYGEALDNGDNLVVSIL